MAETAPRAGLDLDPARSAQAQWAMVGVADRLRVLRAARHAMAEGARELASTVPFDLPGSTRRTLADTLASEVLPLVEACRFLEREAARLLAPVRQPARLRPLWLGGVSVETRREPLGVVLIIGPGNYPLFLPGAQTLQALAAGNAVVWKPAPGGAAAAAALRTLLVANGLNPLLLTVLDESPEAAQAAIDAGVDKVILTGSASTGRTVLRRLAEDLTPAVMELSGCDAVFVLEGGDFARVDLTRVDLARVVEALCFGLRFNGSATCMAPRRLIVSSAVAARLAPMLAAALAKLEPVRVPDSTRHLLSDLTREAALLGAQVLLDGTASDGSLGVGVTLVDHVDSSMRISRTDIFAPVLSILHAESPAEALEVHRACPYALTAAVFGPVAEATALAARIHAGTVLVNDIIVSSADPRVSFGGRGRSGFGVTRGAAGLLEMTAIKNVIVQRSRGRRAWQPTTAAHADLFAALVAVLHGRGLRGRLVALAALVKAGRNLKS